MLFVEDHQSDKLIATIEHEDGPQQYQCGFECCLNPACRCTVITLLLDPIGGVRKSSLKVKIDLKNRSLEDGGESSLFGADLKFAEDFVASLGEEEYQFLAGKHFEIKHGITENAEPSSIRAHFDFPAIEENGEQLAYNDILPYGDQLVFTLHGNTGQILDHFCLLPKCSCTDIAVTAILADTSSGTVMHTCSYSLDYKAKQKKWLLDENESFPVDAEALQAAVETQIPDFYQRLSVRHKKLKSIYAACKRREFAPSQPAVLAKIGRNDPCSCGSGKKFKKCCLGKVR